MSTDRFFFPQGKQRFLSRGCEIRSTGVWFPERIVTNHDIIQANGLKVADAAVKKSLGFEKRRVVDDGLVDSDVLARAAAVCLEKAGVAADDLSKIIVTKFIGDRILPMTASIVQRKLNAQTAMHAFDLEGGINAFLQAFDLAARYIGTTDTADQHILIVSGGIHHLPVSKSDPRLAFMFGDGAAAVLLSACEDTHLMASYSYTNHQYYDAAGTVRLRMDEWFSDTIYEKHDFSLLYHLYRMHNWKDSIDFYLQAAEVIRDRLLEESGLDMSRIDYVLVTENNIKIRNLTLERLGVPAEKNLSVVKEYGNTMSAMLPVLIEKGFREKRFKPGMHVMLISHGEGASGGGLIYKI